MFTISKYQKHRSLYPHHLKNGEGEEVAITQNEQVTLVKCQDILGNEYYGILKKAKGLVMLPAQSFNYSWQLFLKGV